MPAKAWSSWGELRSYKDSNPEDNPDLGLPNAPLVLQVPGKTDSGLRTSHLVEFVDIFPTLAAAASLPPLPSCPEMSNTSLLCTEGSSLMPLLEDPDRPDWKKSVFWQYPRAAHSPTTSRTRWATP